jgi:hypothetical protein
MGVVERIEFTGDMRRILFHFPRANPQISEWCDFDTNKIKPYKPRASKDNGAFSIKTARCPVTVDAETIEEGGEYCKIRQFFADSKMDRLTFDRLQTFSMFTALV